MHFKMPPTLLPIFLYYKDASGTLFVSKILAFVCQTETLGSIDSNLHIKVQISSGVWTEV